MTQAMRKTVLAAALALLAFTVLVVAARPARAAGRAEVQFLEPRKFADAGSSAIERERTLAILAEHVRGLAQGLPGEPVLRVQVLDVDLAGTLQWRHAQEVRVLRGSVDAPRLHLRWTLVEGSRTLGGGEEHLSNIAYPLGRIASEGFDGGLPYEKRLLSDWFQSTVAKVAR